MMAASLGKMPTTSARRLTSLLSRSSGLVLCNLRRCCSGKIQVGQHLGLAVIDEGGELRPFLPQLVGDMAQHGAGLRPIGLQKGLAQRAATTMLCWVFGTCARGLRIQCTRQRCQAAPKTRRIAAFSPS